jgi:pimeloyl-ACP methyl ester carboxylesterase
LKTIFYKNSNISYTDTGKGAAVVLLHGFLENQTLWRNFIPELSKKNRIITLDLLGHGNSDCLGYVHTMEENANAVQQVLLHLRIRKAIFVGHSMGGYVALAFGEKHPQKIKGLVLLNSTAKEDSAERKQNRDRAIKAVKKEYETFVRLAIANLFNPDNREAFLNEIENVKLQALQTPLQGIVASLEGMKIRKDRQFLLQTNAYPQLLILGKKDPVLIYEETANQIKNTSVALVTFPDGHMSAIENYPELLHVLSTFFRNKTVS